MGAIREEMVTTAVIDMIAAGTARPAGDHGTRGTNGEPIDTSGMYTVVHRIDGGGVAGSLGDGHQDVTLVYQVDAVGTSRKQCEGLARVVLAVMTDIAAAGGHQHVLAGSGWVGGLRERQTTGRPEPEGVDGDGRERWTQRERYTVMVHRA